MADEFLNTNLSFILFPGALGSPLRSICCTCTYFLYLSTKLTIVWFLPCLIWRDVTAELKTFSADGMPRPFMHYIQGRTSRSPPRYEWTLWVGILLVDVLALMVSAIQQGGTFL